MENNVKELSKSPFKMDNKLQKEKEAIVKLIDKFSKDVNGDEKFINAIQSMLVKTQDPIKLWIKANALDQLGYAEIAIEFKLKANDLGYVVQGVNENIENNYNANVNMNFKTEIGLDAFKQEMNTLLSNPTIIDNLKDHNISYNSSSSATDILKQEENIETENNMETENTTNEDYTQQFTYEPKELTPWNIFKDDQETIEKPEIDIYAVSKMVEADPMLKFAYSQLTTGDFEKDMKLMYDTYIKKDEDMQDTLKTYESYTSYIIENENNNNPYATKIYEILDLYKMTETMDDSDKHTLALIINKVVKLINKYVDNEKQMFALYPQETKRALVAAFDELTILEIIEKFKSAGFTMQDLKDDETKLNLDDMFGIPPSASNLILYTLTEVDTTDLLYLDKEIASIIFMACTAIVLKASIGLSLD